MLDFWGTVWAIVLGLIIFTLILWIIGAIFGRTWLDRLQASNMFGAGGQNGSGSNYSGR
jgi:hypothetical protein